MATAIEISGLVKTLRPHPGARRARPGRPDRGGARLPRPERRRQVHHHPDPARAAARRRRRRPGCSAATRGATRSQLHRRLAYVPGDVTLWPNLTGGEVIDLLGRLRGGLDAQRRARAAGAVRPRPDARRAATYSKGNRQKVALVAALASDVELLLLDEPTSGLDPLMEAVFRRVSSRRSAAAAARCCCPATSWPRSRRCATGSASSARGRTVETGTLAELRHLTRTSIHGRAGRAADRPGRAARRARPATSTGNRVRCEVDTAQLGRGAAAARRGRRAQPDQPAADPGGAVPAPLRREADPTPATAGPPEAARDDRHRHRQLFRLALRRDRIVG